MAARAETPASVEAYGSYVDWKGWDASGFMTPSERDRHYFAGELAGIPMRRVLELGFGNGAFLAWARERGAEIYGTEIVPELAARGCEAGIHVLPVNLTQAPASLDGSFDCIAAFDVMEHLTLEQSQTLLAEVGRLLRPGGAFIARFPNAQSPLGNVYQHGDCTHLTPLSGAIVGQLVRDTPLEIVRAGNPFDPIFGSLPKRLAMRGRAVARKAVERGIAALYSFDVPLGPNCVVVATRRM
jgi:SAM-dependent methyltransferase